MAIELADLSEPGGDLDGLDWDAEATPAEVGPLNDRAYGWEDGGFAGASPGPRPRDAPLPRPRRRRDRLRRGDARRRGRLPAGDGRRPTRTGAAAASPAGSVTRALLEARDRGLRTASLQASPLGRPVYERLGFGTYGSIEMWERREGDPRAGEILRRRDRGRGRGAERPRGFREAESVVARAAPQLQGILAEALEDGGWFAETHDDEVRKAATGEGGEAERITAVRTLLAEETRMGMLVGVAIGWALATELQGGGPATKTEKETPE